MQTGSAGGSNTGHQRRFSRRVVLEQVVGWSGALAAMTWVHEDEEDLPERVEPAESLITADPQSVAAIAELLPLIAFPLVADVDARDVLLEWTLLADRRIGGSGHAGTSSPVFMYGQDDEVVSRIGFDPFEPAQALTVRRNSGEVTIFHGGLRSLSLAETWGDQGYSERIASFGGAYWLRDEDAWSNGFSSLDELWLRMRGVLDFAAILDSQTFCFSSSEELLLGVLDAVQPTTGQRSPSLAVTSVMSMFGVLPPDTTYAVGKVRGPDSLDRVLPAGDSPDRGNGARLDGYLVTGQSTPSENASRTSDDPKYLLVLQSEASSVLATLRNEVQDTWEKGHSDVLGEAFSSRFELNGISIDRAANAVLVEVAYIGDSTEPIDPALRELIGVAPD